MSQTDLSGLRSRLQGQVLDDRISRTIYSSGACLFRVEPLAVVLPRDRADVLAAVGFAAQRGLSLVGRGGGTSRCGNELGSGLVLDFSRHLNLVLEFNPEERWVRVQPGLILNDLNDFLKPEGLFFPIDPSTQDVCTLGGMIANNSSGPRAVRYGTTRDWVLSLEVVLSDGRVIETAPGTDPAGPDPAAELRRGVEDILARYELALRDEEPEVVKNSAGYHLWRLERGGRVDLTPLLVGSEGTLGLVTEARLSLAPRPERTWMGLLYFEALEPIGPAVQIIRELEPSMIEIIERRILDLARREIEAVRPYLPPGIEALLLVEFEGRDEAGLRDRFARLEEALVRREGLASGLRVAGDAAEMARLAQVRSISGPILNRVKGPRRPLAVIEDAAVHPSRLPEYIAGLRRLFEKFEVEAGIYGHAGDGELHIMVFLDLRRPEEAARMTALAESCYDLVLSLKGTISGEHGDGRLRTQFLRKQYPKLYPAFGEVKNLFDPAGRLNPGIIVGGEDDLLGRDLKAGPESPPGTGTVFDQAWLREEIEACSGCRKCLAYCPVARTEGQEWLTGRAKVSLLRELTAGRLDPDLLASPQFKRVMDACLNCQRCLKECPSGVDVPWLAIQARSEHLGRRGLSRGERFLARTGAWSERAGSLAPLINLANRLAPARRLLEKTLDLDRRRDLPPLQRLTLSQRLARRVGKAGGRPVAYFPGCLERFHTPEQGLDAVAVLEASGFRVLVPEFRCCGLAQIGLGNLDEVLADVEANLSRLAGLVEDGLDVVFGEPSCALAIRDEYPKVVRSERARLVSRRCFDIHEYLSGLLAQGRLNLNLGRLGQDGAGLRVGYHQPCHLRALGAGQRPLELLRLIPGLEVVPYSDLCCGLAGTFGLKKANFDLSLRIGRRLFREIEASKVEVVATSCGACGLQIRQATGRPVTAPISLLAESCRRAGVKA